jgi:Tfp pilus assembly protein PilV
MMRGLDSIERMAQAVRRRLKHAGADQDGFTIIEVLVASMIMIVGVLTALQAVDASRKLTLVAERQTTIAHRAQLELERVKSLPYNQIGLTGTSASWSSTAGDYTYVANPSSSCPATPAGGAPTYQPDHATGGSATTESLVINGCSYTIGGTSTPFTTGTITPVTAWTDGTLSGSVYDFVTWTSDPTCSQTSTSGSICATNNDYKRVTIVVTVNGASHPSRPAVVAGFVANPSAAPPGAPANSQQNPLSSPTTSCVNGSGQTVSCSNTISGTPLQYFPTDCSYTSGSCGTPTCAGHNLHNTIASVLLNPPAPDLLRTTLPTGACTDVSGNPTPPCFGIDLGCGTGGGGVPIKPTGTTTTCGTPPTDNTKTHSWVTPQVPAGTTVNLNGTGSMTAYLESTSSVSVSATVCLGLYIIPGGLLGTLTGNLLSSPIGAAVSATVTATAGVPTPVSFNFNVGQAAVVSSTVLNVARVEVVVWVAASASTNVAFVYDQAQFASQFTLMST